MKRIGFCAALLLVAVLPQTSQAQGQLSCEARTIALEMNTVKVDNLVKTIAVEKEVVTCVECDQNGVCRPLGSQVQDLQLFTDLIERKAGDTFEIVDRRFEAILCTKDPSTAQLLGCRLVPVPVLSTPPAFSGCQGGAEGRVAMNTIVVGNLVKTIKAQKEEFRCGGDVVDLTTFTEIIERREHGTFRIVDKRVEQVVCRKGVGPTTNPNSPRFLDFVTLESCRVLPVPLQ